VTSLSDFEQVIFDDFEFASKPGERPDVVCLAWHEWPSGQTHRLWRDQLGADPPYRIDAGVLHVHFVSNAELGCHLSLGWPLPANVLDLNPVFRNITNGRTVPEGRGLHGALAYFHLPSSFDSKRKAELQKRIGAGWPFTAEEREEILRYCATDVEAMVALLPKILPHIDLDIALHHGEFVATLARMEHAGPPIDMEIFSQLTDPQAWRYVHDAMVPTIDAAYGGLGLSTTVYARIVERISRVWMSVTGIFNSHLIMAAAVQRFGTEAQKQAYLPRFATGELRGGLALTEPDCGTDLQAIRTVARRRGDSYVVNGTKTWISNGIHGQCFALLVKTNPDAEPRHKGMSLFIAEKGDGFKVSRKLEKLGYKGIDSAELVFEDYVIPADRLIGGQEGLGLKHALGGLELGRINVAARGVGLAQAALDQAVAYSQVRKTFGKPICQRQAIQLKLADMATQIHAARLLTQDAAKTYDRGLRCDMEAGMAKLFATETAVNVSLEAMRIHGAYGYSKEFVVERIYRDAPLLVIGEGTNELQRIIIARQLVERNPV